MDRFEAMTAFVAVAELRGFAAAARQLRLSPPTVTRLVASIEERLGARLLQRTTRSVTLTDAGARYLERARRILADLAEAEDAARAERTTPTGRFVVSAPHVFGRLHVAPLMNDYLDRHRAVVGELRLADRMESLVEEGIDAAVRIGTLDDASHVARKVGATRRVVVAGPKYLRRRGTPRAPEDLGEHDLIQFTSLTPTPEWRFGSAGDVRVAFRPRFVTNGAESAIGRAIAGGGLTMVLAYQVVDAVRSKELRVVLADFEPPPLPIQVVYPTTRLLSAKVRSFLELISSSRDWSFVTL
jgi:DNA-binding transcriptional LysR family regulator